MTSDNWAYSNAFLEASIRLGSSASVTDFWGNEANKAIPLLVGLVPVQKSSGIGFKQSCVMAGIRFNVLLYVLVDEDIILLVHFSQGGFYEVESYSYLYFRSAFDMFIIWCGQGVWQ
ncbi:TPA: hypothetical protein TUI13_000708 [Streptococcus equi subsp. zooepidemicus]|nr:hypothetical protein [Streptococcus equi subsp. zooepidemicus]